MFLGVHNIFQSIAKRCEKDRPRFLCRLINLKVIFPLNYIHFSDSSSYADEDIADLYEITKKVEMVSSKWKEVARIKEKTLTYTKLTYNFFFLARRSVLAMFYLILSTKVFFF